MAGIPNTWDAEDVLGFLQDVAWTNCETLGRRSCGRRFASWLVRGTPPASSENTHDFWQYVDSGDSDLVVHIGKPAPRPRKPVNSTSVPPPKKNFRHNMPAEAAEMHDADIKGAELPEQNEQTDKPPAERQVEDEGTARGAARRRVEATGSATNADPPEDILKTFERQGWKVHDLGGNGDCGYRSLIGSKTWSESGQILGKEEARRQAALLRTQVVQYLRRHRDEFAEILVPDEDISPEDIPKKRDKDFVDFLDKIAKPNTWICGLTLFAASRSLGIPIIIWYSHDGYWKRCTLAPGFNKEGYAKCARNKVPIILRLQQEHYCWVQPPTIESIPQGWLVESQVPSRSVLSGSAPSSVNCRSAPSVARSVVTPSVHSYRRPPEPSECHTPSVYSVVPASGAGAAPASGVPAGSRVSVATPSVYSLGPGDVPDGPHAVSSCCPGLAYVHKSGSCRPGDAPLKRMRVKGPCSEAFHVARCVSPCALSQFRSVASAITTNEVNHDDAVPLFRPDVAPYPRQKTVAKPEPPAGQLDIQAEQSWVCPLCEVEVYQEPGLRARELFRRKRWNHLLTRHTAEERRAVPKLGAVSQVVVPSALIPPAQRAWSCPECDKVCQRYQNIGTNAVFRSISGLSIPEPIQLMLIITNSCAAVASAEGRIIVYPSSVGGDHWCAFNSYYRNVPLARRCPTVPFNTAPALECFLPNISSTGCFPIHRAALRLVPSRVLPALQRERQLRSSAFTNQTDNLSLICFSRKSKNYSFPKLVPSFLRRGGR